MDSCWNSIGSRRKWLQHTAAGFGSLALNAMLSKAHGNPLDARAAHLPVRAKRVIFLFMHGGPSSVDTFDYKPRLQADSGKPLPFAKPRVQFAETGDLLGSPFPFRQYGQCGLWVSSLFPRVADLADELCLVKSIHGSNEAHGGALLKIHTGSDTFVRPSVGSWISYGLGTENANLPSFITINPTLGHGGVNNFGSAFLPPIHQATRIGQRGANMKNAAIQNLDPGGISPDRQRNGLDLLRNLEELRRIDSGPDSLLEARIESFELAFRMQTEAPELMNLDSESPATLRLYGVDGGATDNFGRQCLLARRLAESGVRYIQCTHGYWDQHSNLQKEHSKLAFQVDRPIAALVLDLKARGLLDETLVVWGGEFGRTPTAQGKDGRDHNPHAFTWWFAGGGVRPGYSHGVSDDFGYYSQSDRVHIHDLHATILALLGVDHERLTHRYGGRDFRLTDVAGRVVEEMMIPAGK